MRATIERYVRTGYFDVMLTHHRWTLVNQSALPLIELAASMGLGVVNAAVEFDGGAITPEPVVIKVPRLSRTEQAATIAQDNDLTLDQAWEHVLALKGAAVAMFPGKEDTFDLLYLPRFSRLLQERFGAN